MEHSLARRRTLPAPAHLRTLLTALAALLLAGVSLLAAPPANAEAPVRLPDRLTDLTSQQVLSTGRSEAQSAINNLESKGKYRLWAVYVDSFDGLAPEDWAWDTAELSALGEQDYLLAIAVEDGAWSSWAGMDISDSLWDRTDDRAYSALQNVRSGSGSWAQVTVAAADALAASSGGGGGGGWVFVGVLVAVLVGVSLFVRSSKKKKGATGAAKGGAAGSAAAVPTAQLVQRSGSALVGIDDELRSFEEDLGFAEAQFGSDAIGPYTRVLEESKAKVAQAFALRRQLDAAPTEDQQRALATQILSICDQVSATLQQQSAGFEALRQEQANAPKLIRTLTARAEEVTRQIPVAQAALQSLAAQYPASSLASVSHNPEQAQQLVTGAAGALQTAQQELAAGNPSAAVGPIRVAATALGQAEDLLAAVERARTDLASAGGKIATATASLNSDIAEAQQLAPGDPKVGALVAQAQNAIAQARLASGPGGDPLAALSALSDCEVALDEALAQYRQQADVARRAQSQVVERAARLDSTIRGVNDYIAARRGAVGPEARTELAEAIRLYSLSQQLAATDPNQALAAVQAGEQHAARAQELAQRDVSSWEASQRRSNQGGRGGGGGVDLGSLLLGGMLLGGNNRGSRWGGGSSWGSPGGSWGAPPPPQRGRTPTRGSSWGGSSTGGAGRSRSGGSGGGRSGGGRSGGGRSGGGRSGGGGGRSRGGRF